MKLLEEMLFYKVNIDVLPILYYYRNSEQISLLNLIEAASTLTKQYLQKLN
jgi:hypothetical protein